MLAYYMNYLYECTKSHLKSLKEIGKCLKKNAICQMLLEVLMKYSKQAKHTNEAKRNICVVEALDVFSRYISKSDT